MKSAPGDPDRVHQFLSLLEPAAGPSGHIDDDTLTLIRMGDASAGELETVRAHLTICPSCRRLVSEVLSSAERAPAATGGTRWRRPGLSGFVSWAAAACMLVGLSVLCWAWITQRPSERHVAQVESGPSPIHAPAEKTSSIEVLVAQLDLVPSASRGATRAQTPETRGPDQSGSNRLPPGEDFFIKINPPHDGVAAVVRVTPDQWELLGRKRNQEFRVRSGNINKPFGPILSPQATAAYVVVITDFLAEGELSDTIRKSLPASPAGIADIDGWRADVSSRLARAGHRWMSIEPIRLEPAKSENSVKPGTSRTGPEH